MSAARILVVGRHPDIMQRVKGILASAGYTHLGALTDAEALDQMSVGEPDVLLIGGGVEETSREALTRAFRLARPGRPVVAHAGGPHGLLANLKRSLGEDP